MRWSLSLSEEEHWSAIFLASQLLVRSIHMSDVILSVACLLCSLPLLLSGSFPSFDASVSILLHLHSTPRRSPWRMVFVLQWSFSCFISNFHRIQTDLHHLNFCCPFCTHPQIEAHGTSSYFGAVLRLALSFPE